MSDEQRELRRFRSQMFRLAIMIAFGEGFLFGTLASAFDLPSWTLGPLGALGMIWLVLSMRR